MTAAAFATPLAAVVAGMITSMHCAVMCGPLGCALLGTRGASERELRQAALGYHGARLVSYAAIGALLGAMGSAAGGIFHAPISRLLPWVMAAFFVIVAFGWERKLPQLPFIGRRLMRLNMYLVSRPRFEAASLLGLATPFLPCGPLYLAFGVALVSGSGIAGATLLFCFALGTIPLYVLAQAGAWRLQARLAPATQLWTRRILALGSAALIGGRAISQDGSLLEPIRCLLCH